MTIINVNCAVGAKYLFCLDDDCALKQACIVNKSCTTIIAEVGDAAEDTGRSIQKIVHKESGSIAVKTICTTAYLTQDYVLRELTTSSL